MYSRLLAVVCGLALIGMTVVHAQHNQAKLTTQDYIDIQQLYARYNMAIDTGDGEGWAGYLYARWRLQQHEQRARRARAVHQGLARKTRRRKPSSFEFEHGVDADGRRRKGRHLSLVAERRRPSGNDRHDRDLRGRAGEDAAGVALQEPHRARRSRAADWN